MPARDRLRLLLVTPFLPDPGSSHGGGSYLGSLCRGLAEHADLGLVTLLQPGEQVRQAGGPWHSVHSLPYLGRRHPRSVRHALTMGFRCLLRRLPLVAAKHWHPKLPELLRQTVAEFRPHCALVELASMAQYLPHLSMLPTVLTDHEAGAPTRTVTGYGRAADRYDLRLWRGYVRRHYRQATLLQALTSNDAAVLGRAVGREVLVRAPLVDVPAARVHCEQAPPRALFLGDYRHHPNPEAAQHLVRDVLPLLRQRLPETELVFAGPHSEHLHELGKVPGVHVIGYVADLRALLSSARCLLAPLYSGGGFRVKVLTALGHGLPVVTNALGAQGIGAPAEAMQCCETPQQLADATLRWLQSPALVARAADAAHAWATEHVAPIAVAEAQLARIERLLG